MTHWHLSPHTMIREKRNGIQGVSCDRCRYWQPLIHRSDEERAKMKLTAPAHERYQVTRNRSEYWRKLWRRA